MLPINTGSWSRASTWDTFRLWLSESGGLRICGSEKHVESIWNQIWSHDNFSFLMCLGYTRQTTDCILSVHWYTYYCYILPFCSLMINPWGSLSTPTPAPLTAAMVIQYCFPGWRVEMSRLWWPLSTVQFWYCCSSGSTHHTWKNSLHKIYDHWCFF